jgi:AcrR family transcriptional regulator
VPQPLAKQSKQSPVGPGRPRDPRIDDAILDATETLLARHGYDGLTLEAVAEAAQVGRPTIYRRWPDKAHLVLATVSRGAGRPIRTDTGSLRGDLLAIHRRQVRLFESEVFRNVVPALVAKLSTDMDLADAYVHDFVDLRRRDVNAALERAIARGELNRHVDIDAVFDVLTGPVFYRVVVRREGTTRHFGETLVDALITTLASQ